jgi:hypothetical protein
MGGIVMIAKIMAFPVFLYMTLRIINSVHLLSIYLLSLIYSSVSIILAGTSTV